MTRAELRPFLRRLWANVTAPFSLWAIILVTAITALSGPLGTYEHVPASQRWFIWVIITLLAAFFFHTIDGLIGPYIERSRRVLHACATGAGMALLYAPLAICLFCALSQTYGVPAPDIKVAAIAFLATFTFDMFRGAKVDAQDPGDLPDTIPVDWAKLNVNRGDEVLALSADDHYIRVQTMGGEHRLLFRFGDALELLALIEGVRVHRSHWVAIAAIERIEQKAGRHVVVLANGARIPVSRGRLDDISSALASKKAVA